VQILRLNKKRRKWNTAGSEGGLPLKSLRRKRGVSDVAKKQARNDVPMTPELEQFKYEVAQEIGISNRKNKKFTSS